MLIKSDSKFIQIAASQDRGYMHVVALDDKGVVWRFDNMCQQWMPMPTERGDGRPIED